MPDERVAKILAEANLFNDKTTARRWGVSERSIRRWRANWEDDEEKEALLSVEAERLSLEWAKDATRSMKIAFAKAEELIQEGWGAGQLTELSGFIQTVGELRVTDQALKGD